MKRLVKFIVYTLVICLTVTSIPPLPAAAATSVNEVASETEVPNDDGLLTRQEADFKGASKMTTFAVDSNALKHDSKFNGYLIEDGIDISHHNGKVNWEKVKADGVEFAIIRMAYRGYGPSGNIVTDNYAFENLEGAKAAGLDVGVYFFSQAITVKEAKEEANYILKLIDGYDLDLPVVMDFEYTAGEAGRLYAAKLTDRQRTNICLAFCEVVEAAGYDAMVYANKSMLTGGLYADEIDAKYEIWLAEWTTKASYKNDYTYWQYTSDGSVDGVPSARVDMNVRYVYKPFEITDFTDTTVTMEWRPIDEAEGYVIYRKINDGAYEIVAQLDDPSVTTYTDTELAANTVYSYFVRYYKTDENGQQVIYKSGYPAKKAMTTLKLQQIAMTGAAVDAASVKLTWEKEPNAVGYVLQQYDTTKKKYVDIANITDAVPVITEEGTEQIEYVKTDLQLGTTYKYRVCAFADVGGAIIYGDYSEPVSVKTASKLIKPVLTAKPYSYTTNKLSWKKVPGATGYQIQRYNYATKKWVLLKTIKNGNTTKYSHTYLNCNTTYRYRIRATATVGGKKVNSYYSAAKLVKTKGSRIGVVKAGPLNIRTGPGTGYKKLIQVKKGRQLTITGSTAKWYRVKIKVKGKYKVGYVSKSYVKLK